MAAFYCLISTPVKMGVAETPGVKHFQVGTPIGTSIGGGSFALRVGDPQWVDRRYFYSTNVQHMAVSITAVRSP